MSIKRIPIFWSVFTVIVLQVLGISTLAMSQAIDSIDYFPLESGMEWTYLEDGLNSITLSILPGHEFINGYPTKVVLQSGGEDSGMKTNYSNDMNGISEHKEFAPDVFIDGVGFQDITVVLTPPMKFANPTVNLGDIINSTGTVKYTFSGLGTYPLNYSSTAKFAKLENVTVPLGTFVTVKIQNSLTISGTINNQFITETSTRTFWLAKYIGLVKSISNTEGVQTTNELVSINFQPFLSADFKADQTAGVSPHTVNFSDQSAGHVSNWSWNFGDNGTSTAQNPEHTYNTPGNYTVSLTVNGLGGSDTETKANYITINYPPPESAFSVNKTTGVLPHTVNFMDQSDGTISSWSWNFGDGSTSTSQNPEHTYNTPGNHTVSLTVTGPGGSDTETKTNYIRIALPGGDLNKDMKVDIRDLILVLQILAKVEPQPTLPEIADINGDMRIGLEEAIYILKFLSY